MNAHPSTDRDSWENGPTARFLDASRASARALDRTGPAFDRFRSWFTRPLLSRPVFLDAEEARGLDHDLTVLLRTLHALPERLFDGDEAAFAAAAGWHPPAVAEPLRLLSGPTVPLGRADLVRRPGGFSVVECNTSSSLGSFEFGELCRAFLSDPSFAAFARDAGLDYLDPLREMAATMLATAGLGPAERPVVALVNWVSSPIDVNPSLFVGLMEDLGFTVLVCRIDELESRGGALHYGGTRIDIAYRTFLLKTVAAEPGAAEILEPLARAVADGAVTLFSPLNADLYGSKLCLAMLSDPRHRGAFTAAELDVIDRVLPWTRVLEDGSADVDGTELPLVKHALQCREDLVLKPGIGHAGRGVVGGWMVGEDEWERLVREAAEAGGHVLQRRVPSAAERFYDHSRPEPSRCLLHWGLFITGSGLSGGFVKGLLDHDQDIRYLGDGSHVGCVFHHRLPSTPL